MKRKTQRAEDPPLVAPPLCELCAQTGGELLWRDKRCRVVLVADPDYAGFCRVIWHAHVREMTDLTAAEQAHCMRVVFAVERALRDVLNPHKINLASLGNMTPHLHWHVIAARPARRAFSESGVGERTAHDTAERRRPDRPCNCASGSRPNWRNYSENTGSSLLCVH